MGLKRNENIEWRLRKNTARIILLFVWVKGQKSWNGMFNDFIPRYRWTRREKPDSRMIIAIVAYPPFTLLSCTECTIDGLLHSQYKPANVRQNGLIINNIRFVSQKKYFLTNQLLLKILFFRSRIALGVYTFFRLILQKQNMHKDKYLLNTILFTVTYGYIISQNRSHILYIQSEK